MQIRSHGYANKYLCIWHIIQICFRKYIKDFPGCFINSPWYVNNCFHEVTDKATSTFKTCRNTFRKSKTEWVAVFARGQDDIILCKLK